MPGSVAPVSAERLATALGLSRRRYWDGRRAVTLSLRPSVCVCVLSHTYGLLFDRSSICPSRLLQFPVAFSDLSLSDIDNAQMWSCRRQWSVSVKRTLMAAFTYVGPCSEKNVGPLHLFFPRKKLACQLSVSWKTDDLFFLLIALVNSGESPIISVFRACKKFAAPFVGAPVRPNRRNMAKSASADSHDATEHFDSQLTITYLHPLFYPSFQHRGHYLFFK